MITIKDPGQTLSVTQVDTLTAKAGAYPFDIQVYIGTGGQSRAQFENDVASYVRPGSRIVSIGVDPVHHFTFVRSSASLGVPAGPQVASAGNSFFKSGNLVEGIDAIAAKASQLRVEPVAIKPFVAGPDQKVIQSQTGVPIIIQENHTSSGVWWGTGAFVLAVTAVVAYVVWRARKARQKAMEAEAVLTEEAAEYAAKNVGISKHYDLIESSQTRNRQIPVAAPVPVRSTIPKYSPPYQAPRTRTNVVSNPSPVIINQGSNNSALDMLVGYELGKSTSSPAPVVEREIIREVPVKEESSSSFWSSSSSDYDSSSSSSWSSSSDSSSSSSWDSGSSDSGSSSSWD